MTRLMGIDLGDQRIGIAIADDAGRTRPLATIRRATSSREDAIVLDRFVAEQRISEVIVGLPLELSGDEGPQAIGTRAWANEVERLLRVPVAFRDERRTTVRAADRVGPGARGRSGGPPSPSRRGKVRARLDREAACLILQDEIDARAASFTDDAGTSRQPRDPGA